jgi:hypothetical protein
VVVSIFLAARRVGAGSVIVNYVLPHGKLQHVIFSLVLHVGSVTALAIVGDNGMVIARQHGVNFVNGDVGR